MSVDLLCENFRVISNSYTHLQLPISISHVHTFKACAATALLVYSIPFNTSSSGKDKESPNST